MKDVKKEKLNATAVKTENFIPNSKANRLKIEHLAYLSHVEDPEFLNDCSRISIAAQLENYHQKTIQKLDKIYSTRVLLCACPGVVFRLGRNLSPSRQEVTGTSGI
jgi:hypothetical protein